MSIVSSSAHSPGDPPTGAPDGFDQGLEHLIRALTANGYPCERAGRDTVLAAFRAANGAAGTVFLTELVGGAWQTVASRQLGGTGRVGFPVPVGSAAGRDYRAELLQRGSSAPIDSSLIAVSPVSKLPGAAANPTTGMPGLTGGPGDGGR